MRNLKEDTVKSRFSKKRCILKKQIFLFSPGLCKLYTYYSNENVKLKRQLLNLHWVITHSDPCLSALATMNSFCLDYEDVIQYMFPFKTTVTTDKQCAYCVK